jgi:hypothetical protein
MPITAWNHWITYDVARDCEVICVTGYTGRGAYWIKAPLAPAGKSRRAQREDLLSRIDAAVERDDERIRDGGVAAEVGEVGALELVEDGHGRGGKDRGIW